MPTDTQMLEAIRFEPTPAPTDTQRAITAFLPAGQRLWAGMAAIVWEPAVGHVASVYVVDVELVDGKSLRRRGIASRLWDLAEAAHGDTLTDDGCLTIAGSRFLNATRRPRAPFVQRVRDQQARRVVRRNLWQWPPLSEDDLAALVRIAVSEQASAA